MKRTLVMRQVQASGGGERRRGKRNNGSCQSHFIVESLFMNTLSGWKDLWGATHVSDCGSCAVTIAPLLYCNMGLICLKGIC